jgi:hypothetical protein
MIPVEKKELMYCLGTLWPVFNNMVCPQGWSLARGANLYSRAEQIISSPGEKIHPWGKKFTPRGKNSPLGDNFAPGGQGLPIGVKLRMGLCHPLVGGQKGLGTDFYDFTDFYAMDPFWLLPFSVRHGWKKFSNENEFIDS